MKKLIIVCSFLIPVKSYSQTQLDSSLIFEKHKKSLNQPLTNFTKVPQPNVPNKDLLGKMVSYITKGPDAVRAIFDGKIVSVTEVGNSYLLMTRFGNYYISYYGLSEPLVKEGDFVRQNEFISKLSGSAFGQFFLTVQFYKDDIEVDPNEWFK